MSNHKFNYFDSKKGDDVIVFIHGFPFNCKMWDGQLDYFRDYYRCIAYDIRGFGKSKTEHYYFSIDLFVEDLKELLDELSLPKVTLCGLSMGGYIALRFIEKYPQYITRLVLCNTKAEADNNDGKAGRANSVQKILKEGKAAFVDGFIHAIFTDNSIKENNPSVDAIKNMMMAADEKAICHTLIALAARTDTTNVLSTIQIPTLIITGEKDIIAPPKIVEEMHSKVSKSEIKIIPNAAHMSNLENPEIFNQTILNFLTNKK
ncbi:MAG: alpha/beta fold hydrolase [Bacteroidetes bacterium]|nr:alpha/beta fold hydrolase [Bacteroidota bacterium]